MAAGRLRAARWLPWVTWEGLHAGVPIQDGYGRRAEQLDLKEKELRAKEAELRKLETDLRATGALRPEKNWPRCCPFTHHDIAGEVGAARACCRSLPYQRLLLHAAPDPTGSDPTGPEPPGSASACWALRCLLRACSTGRRLMRAWGHRGCI
jgi:hypothetical protein